jgi:plasmid stabilization system protein ParE
MHPFNFHPEAQIDLENTWDFISAHSVDAADRVIAEILQAIRTASSFPPEGHKRPDLTSRPLHFLHVREYLSAYAPEEAPPLVIGVIHGRRSPRGIAAALRTRQ